MVKSVTGTSGAASAQTVTITMPSNKKRIFIRNICVTTKTADIGGDVDIVVNDNGTAVWAAVLRSAKVYGAVFDMGKGIPIRDGDATIVVDSAGAGAVSVCSVIYEIL
jgi:hypothetical protein